MPGCLIAGISGAGKTHLHRAVLEAVASAGREIVMALPQAMATTAHLHLSDDPIRQAEEIIDWCNSVLSFAELVQRKAIVGGLTSKEENYPFNWTPMLLLEGFLFDFPLHDFSIARADCLPFEERLHALGVVLVVLRVPDERILEQSVLSTREHRGAGWSEHLAGLGASDEERAAHFRRQQDLLLAWAQASPLPCLEIVTDAFDWKEHATRVVRFVDERAAAFVS